MCTSAAPHGICTLILQAAASSAHPSPPAPLRAAHGGQVCCPLDIVASAVEEWTGCECPALPTDGEPRVWQVSGGLGTRWTAHSEMLGSVIGSPSLHEVCRRSFAAASCWRRQESMGIMYSVRPAASAVPAASVVVPRPGLHKRCCALGESVCAGGRGTWSICTASNCPWPPYSTAWATFGSAKELGPCLTRSSPSGQAPGHACGPQISVADAGAAAAWA